MTPKEQMEIIEEQIKVHYVYMSNVVWLFERMKKLTEALEEIVIRQGIDNPSQREIARKALESDNE